ncbi:MAG: cytosine permease, partial [Nannocystaceae bacterium]
MVTSSRRIPHLQVPPEHPIRPPVRALDAGISQSRRASSDNDLPQLGNKRRGVTGSRAHARSRIPFMGSRDPGFTGSRASRVHGFTGFTGSRASPVHRSTDRVRRLSEVDTRPKREVESLDCGFRRLRCGGRTEAREKLLLHGPWAAHHGSAGFPMHSRADTTREVDGLVELLTPPDDPVLRNPDLDPTGRAQRTWNRWNLAALWVGMSVCVPTYMLASSLIASGMNWWQAMLAVLLGNLLVMVPMILNGHAGTRYGIPFPVFARAAFGVFGSHIPSLARALVACGWFGIQTYIGGEAISAMIGLLWDGWATLGGGAMFIGLSVTSWITFLLFWLLNVYFVWRGTESI